MDNFIYAFYFTSWVGLTVYTVEFIKGRAGYSPYNIFFFFGVVASIFGLFV